MHKPATYSYVIVNSFEPTVVEGVEPYEGRSFIQLMDKYKVRLLSNIKTC